MSGEPVSIDIFPELVYEEDLTPDCGVEIDEICEKIHKACKGWGCDKKALIEALGETTYVHFVPRISQSYY